MRKVLYLIIIVLTFNACKKAPSVSKNNILAETALRYKGVPYKYGGVTTSGMDCSGLLFKAFGDLGKPFPRNSAEQSYVFTEVNKRDIRVGDLVYFKIGRTSKINHTGVVTKIVNNETILFLHSSSSAGVREDNLYSKYWRPKFVKVTRPKI